METKQLVEQARQELCGELKAFMKDFGEKAKAKDDIIRAHLTEAIEGTDLEGTPIEEISFDTAYFDGHGVIYAKEEKKPDLKDILEAIFGGDPTSLDEKFGGMPQSFKDAMAFEIVEEDARQAWGQERERAS